MKSDVVLIDNGGSGFDSAVDDVRRFAQSRQLSETDILTLQLITEEMLSLVNSVTGDVQASFWAESEGDQYVLHLSAKTDLDKRERYQLISAASSRKNEAAKSFLGYLRDRFEAAMAAEPTSVDEVPVDVMADVTNLPLSDPEWDGYERSVLRKVADQIQIAIRHNTVDMTVTKKFGE